jgi:hypothetical protein
LLVLALLGSIGCAGAVLLAVTIAAASVHPAPVNSHVPPQVRAAIVGLREACAAWPPATPTTPPRGAPALSMPVADVATLRERTLCAFADTPEQVLLRQTLTIGSVGTILFFIGFFVFVGLREALNAVRNWRRSIGAKSW